MKYYNALNEYYKSKFGERVLKICVDGGFTCPNRDGKKGTGGCLFCSERGAGENIKYSDVKTQVQKHLESYRGMRANKFIVYFQSFSNTYSDIESLRKIYDSALISDKIIGIAIATRPDCIDEKVVELLKSYQDKYFVMVELGLQTADEKIMSDMNLCYTVKDFEYAVKLLKAANIEVVTHMMVGLPNESKESLDKTINIINRLKIDGVKIHNLYISDNSPILKLWEKGEIKEMSVDEYLDKLEYIITHLNKDIIIHRLCADAPKDNLVAPQWNSHKKYILNGIIKRMRENGTIQGLYYKKN